MKLNKILFPTDFSHSGAGAMKLASSLARDADARLLIVHVEESPLAYGGGEMYYGIAEPDTDELKKMLAEVVPSDSNVPYEHHLIAGEPASALVEFAKKEKVDLIVMGTHGRTGLSRLLIGSVAEAVMRRAHCPVLTYKQPAEEPDTAQASPSA